MVRTHHGSPLYQMCVTTDDLWPFGLVFDQHGLPLRSMSDFGAQMIDRDWGPFSMGIEKAFMQKPALEDGCICWVPGKKALS